jgi:transposase
MAQDPLSHVASWLTPAAAADGPLTGGGPVIALIAEEKRLGALFIAADTRGAEILSALPEDIRKGLVRVSFGVHPNQIYNWKKQLLDGAAGVFESAGAAASTASETQVDLLYRQIGQLKVENDFLARKLGK